MGKFSSLDYDTIKYCGTPVFKTQMHGSQRQKAEYKNNTEIGLHTGKQSAMQR